MPTRTLRAGAGRAQIELPAELFPTEGFLGVHDVLQARVLLLQSEVGIALVSLELTSLPQAQLAALQKTVGQAAGLAAENVLVCATHTFSTPHFLPVHLCKTPADQEKNDLLFQAVNAAAALAVAQAVLEMEDARFGCESGLCDVNVNRDILTPGGWWLGSNETGPSDKSVTVLRFEALDGKPIALLFSYAVQSSVMDGSQTTGGGRLVSADLAGAACQFLEQEYAGSMTALFCIGAAGDQAPSLQARVQYAGKDGSLKVEDIHEQGFAIATLLGKRLGIEVLRIAEQTKCQPLARSLSLEKHMLKLPGQKMIDMQSIHPTHQYTFLPAEERQEPVEMIRLGDVALIGVRPELCSLTAAGLKDKSPFPKTLLLTMVNGGAKYMPDDSAYDRITYEAMNSPFARGSAELLCQEVLERLISWL